MILFDSVVGLFDDQAGDFDDGDVVNATVTILFDSVNGLFDDQVGDFDDQSISGLQATSEVGSVIATANQSVVATITGVSATSAIGTVVASGESFAVASVTGVEGVSSIGTVLALATGSGIATISGVSADSSVGAVSVSVQTSRKGRKRTAKFLEFNPRPVEISISAVAMPGSVQAIADLTLVEAAGGISGTAKLYAIEAQTDIQAAQAGGIINPTDEELIFLLAA